MASLKEALNELAAGVVGIGNEVVGDINLKGDDQGEELIEQAVLPSVGGDDSLVNASDQRDCGNRGRGTGEDGDRLTGVSHNEFGLGVGLGFLVEEFDARHFLAFPGSFDSVGEEDGSSIDAKQRENS